MEEKSKKKYLILALIMGMTFILIIGAVLHARKPFAPENTTEGINKKRSQVMVSGDGYTTDKTRTRKHNKVTKVNSSKIVKKESSEKKKNTGSNQSKDDSKAVKDSNSSSAGRDNNKGGSAGKKDPDVDDPTDINKIHRDGDDEKHLTEEERKQLPIIKTSLVSGDEAGGKYKRFWVTATDYKGRNIPVFSVGDGYMTVLANREKLSSTGASSNRTYFTAKLRQGRNDFTITAVDRRGKKRTITRWIRGDSSKPAVVRGDVSITVSARIIGLGTLASGNVTMTEGESVEDLLKTLLDRSGFNYTISGGYLAAIGKTGIAEGWSISDETREKLQRERSTERDTSEQNMNRLREGDFYNTSGWMYSVNGETPQVGIGSYVPEDGDDIQVFFALSQDTY
ncbi:MAG: DUF4430 domain-containing protein [Eubacteriales bacterium]|nr:DUF4430 domain-containing protein [Eubacteriales bacterium]